jgi:hypothetical protein
MREREHAPHGLLHAILTLRAYARAKDVWDDALRTDRVDKLPGDWDMLNHVKQHYAEIHAEILQARLAAAQAKGSGPDGR